MKTKGITIWERHVEHIVIGVVLIAVVALFAMQLLSSSSTVEKGGKAYSPGTIDDALKSKAAEISDQIQPNRASPLVITAQKPGLGAFKQRLALGVSPVDGSWPEMFPRERRAGLTTAIAQDPVQFYVPEISPATKVVSVQNFDALADQVVMDNPELREQFPDYDITWITAAAVFPMAEVVKQFQWDDPARDQQRIPDSWYDGRITVLDVHVHREQYVDGVWQTATELDLLPGQVSFRERLQAKLDRQKGDQLLSDAQTRASADQLLRPDFFELQTSDWAPPDPRIEPVVAIDAGLNEDEIQLQRVTSSLVIARGKRERVEAEIAEQCGDLGGLGGDDRGGGGGGGRDDDRGGGGGGAPGGGFGVGGSGGGRRAPGDGRKARVKCENLKKNLQRIDRKITDYEREIENLGGDVAAVPEPAEENGDELLVWAFDVTAEIGGEYRYRFTIDVYNPFFARGYALTPEQIDMGNSFVLSSEPSEWSAPVRVGPPIQFFVDKANAPNANGGFAGGGVSLGSATFDVFRFQQGKWWLSSFRVEPGEQVGRSRTWKTAEGEQITVDFTTGRFLLDLMDEPLQAAEDTLVLLQHTMTGEVEDPRSMSRDARDRIRMDLEGKAERAKQS